MEGIGYMLKMLGGNRSTVEAFTGAVGKVIALAEVKDDALFLSFTDGTGIKFFDDGQSCCESRYYTCDDDLAPFVGATLNGAEVRDGPEHEDGEYGDVHEEQFLVVQTSKGDFTVASHNEHNGYYGGIDLTVETFDPAAQVTP